MKIQGTTLVAAGVLVACAGGATEVCTLIGCIGALTIAVDSAPPGPYHIELVSVTHGQRTYDCTDPSGKCAVARFEEYTPDRLIVTVTNGRGTLQYNIAPVYTNSYPNGPKCGSACRSATVTVAVP